MRRPTSAKSIPTSAQAKLLAEYHQIVSMASGDCATTATATSAAVREPLSPASQRKSKQRQMIQGMTQAIEYASGASRRSCATTCQVTHEIKSKKGVTCSAKGRNSTSRRGCSISFCRR